MKKNVLHHTRCLPLMATALTLLTAACTESDEIVGQNAGQENTEGVFTQFVAMSPVTRTTMDADGNFQWTAGDNIWVKVGDTFLGATATTDGTTAVTTPVSEAVFNFGGTFTKAAYEVYYTGTASTSPDEVVIAASQQQYAPNSGEHLGANGDCGVATATRNGSGDYEFALDHKAAYIVFEPTTDHLPLTDYCRIKKITVREKNGKSICGTYPFTSAGLDVANVTNGGSQIELVCGIDVKEVDSQTGSTDLLTEGDGTYPNGFFISNTPQPDKNRCFMVIAPGDYELEVTYDIAYYIEQKGTHIEDPDLHLDPSNPNVNYKGWTFTTSEIRRQEVKDLNAEFKVNHYRSIKHKLAIVDKTIPAEFQFEFEHYYQWGAKKWLFDGVAEFPMRNDEVGETNAPVAGDDRWHSTKTAEVDRLQPFYAGQPDWEERNYWRDYFWDSSYKLYFQPSKSTWAPAWITKATVLDQAQNNVESGNPFKQGVTANQMSLYVVYGDPYLDNTTEWLLKTFNGYATVCTGGVWLKKKAVITNDLQAINPDFQWPGDDDYIWYSKWDYDNGGKTADQKKVLRNQQSAPLPYDEVNNPQVYNQGSWPAEYKDKRFNLRFLAPGFNYRTPLKHGKPSDDGKDMNDYFFLPCLGYYSYTYKDKNGVDHSGKPTLILVGGQGFYWTRTPVMYNLGGTKYYYWNYDTGAQHTNNTAFYLNIHYNYIALSWQNAGDNLRTGMRVATKDLFK